MSQGLGLRVLSRSLFKCLSLSVTLYFNLFLSLSQSLSLAVREALALSSPMAGHVPRAPAVCFVFSGTLSLNMNLIFFLLRVRAASLATHWRYWRSITKPVDRLTTLRDERERQF